METKPMWQSKTVWAVAVTLASAVAGIWGKQVSAEDQAQLVEIAATVAAAAGSAAAVWGRIKAEKRLSGLAG